ncbi:hypothetical protein [Solimonas marina]|uniref:Uncharacterized protein n=1 Tax=Solimonas marina TaxID=2714601 RepID=A0A970B5R0_9GAMM|nr:hypothetical protein [Solimonas marina]NKF21983.1 hypothetical protein [Solimonas marina]
MKTFAYAAAAATPSIGAVAPRRRPARSQHLSLRTWTAALMLLLGAAALTDLSVDPAVRGALVEQMQLR